MRLSNAGGQSSKKEDGGRVERVDQNDLEITLRLVELEDGNESEVQAQTEADEEEGPDDDECKVLHEKLLKR